MVSTGLSFLSGWSDVVCVVRFNVFAGMQTGNIVMCGRVLADSDHPALDVFFYGAMVTCGLLGMAAYEWIKLHKAHISDSRHFALPLAALIILSDVLDSCFGGSRWHACPVAVSLGCQNALTASVFGVSTTIMTGNLGKVGAFLAQLCTTRSASQPLPRLCEQTVFPLVVLATILGALTGAGLHRIFAGDVRFHLLPIAVLQALCLVAGGDGTSTCESLWDCLWRHHQPRRTSVRNESRAAILAHDAAALASEPADVTHGGDGVDALAREEEQRPSSQRGPPPSRAPADEIEQAAVDEMRMAAEGGSESREGETASQ